MNQNMKKRILIILGLIIVVLLLIMAPFAIEVVLFNETIFPFNLPIRINRDGWFSFIGSYLGAIGTVLLGALALWQTKKYKKASDETDKAFQTLQENIKELVQANTDLAAENKHIQESIKSIVEKNTSFVEASNGLQTDLKNLTESNSELQRDMKNIVEHIPTLIEDNSKIQEEVCEVMRSNKDIMDSLLKIQTAIFFPRLTVLRRFEISDYGKLSENMDLKEDVFANVVFGYRDDLGYGNWAENLEGEYGYFAFPLFNDGEKDIVSFKFEQMDILKNFLISFQMQSVDVRPKQTVWCVFAVEKENFEKMISSIVNRGLIKLDFSASNTIGETFILSFALIIDEINEGNCFFLLNYIGTSKVDSLIKWYEENR